MVLSAACMMATSLRYLVGAHIPHKNMYFYEADFHRGSARSVFTKVEIVGGVRYG